MTKRGGGRIKQYVAVQAHQRHHTHNRTGTLALTRGVCGAIMLTKFRFVRCSELGAINSK